MVVMHILDYQKYYKMLKDNAKLTMETNGDELDVFIDGEQIGSVPTRKIGRCCTDDYYDYCNECDETKDEPCWEKDFGKQILDLIYWEDNKCLYYGNKICDNCWDC